MIFKAHFQVGTLVFRLRDGRGVVDLAVHVGVKLVAVDVHALDQRHLGRLGRQRVVDK